MMKRCCSGLGLAVACLSGLAGAAPDPLTHRPPALAHLSLDPAPVLSPEEQLETFKLPPEFRMELVAAEPMVQDPVVLTFDEDGRLWVVEMRGFMPNLEGEGEEEPVGRISILEDTQGDGRMDKATVFLDGLVLPRAVAVVRGGALVAENLPLWFVSRGEPEESGARQVLIDPDYGGTGLPEHSANGLWRGLDNWHYNAKSQARYRWIRGEWVREETEFRGQWGISHDDFGRLFYNYNWSQLHADLAPPNFLSRNPHHRATSGIGWGVATNQAVFPARMNTAVNRGYIPGALDGEGRLLEFTSAGAPFIYRGAAFPPEFRGNAFVCEPAGNLIKRNLVEERGLEVSARFAYEESEFLVSTDERFRPVWLASGPDGALYVADMYRGLIQHRAHITPYLREESRTRGLDRPVGLGRIWRVVPLDWKPSKAARLSQADPAQLIELLSHPNGWQRDTAQRLLVERQDPASRPGLRELALHGTSPLGRLHALWTLEGLADPEPEALFAALRDPHSQVQAAAIRVIELLAAERPAAQAALARELRESGPALPLEAAFQAALTLGNLPGDRITPLVSILTRYAEVALMRDGVLSSLSGWEFPFLETLWTRWTGANESPGQAIFLELLASALTKAGNPDHLGALLGKLDDPLHFGWRERALLAGTALHAGGRDSKRIRLEAAPAVLERLEAFGKGNEQRQLERLFRLFEWPGHEGAAPEVSEARPLTETEQHRFILGRQQYLTACAPCHGMDGTGSLPLGPPLVDSEWVLGPVERLVRILLHGMEGPVTVDGRRYDAPEILPEMPSLAVLDNESIAAVLTYLRREWGHAADPVTPLAVARIRVTSQGRVHPWTEAELLEVRP